MKKLLLDAFCGAGGATKGYQRAGFYVVGVDIGPQPNYCGDEFYQDDAIDFIKNRGHEFDAIHTSPPCQRYTKMARQHKTELLHPDLIALVRDCMPADVPWVIENVLEARPELRQPIMLCGTTFNLGVFRHRLFESSIAIAQPRHYRHPGRIGDGRYVTVTGHSGGRSHRDGIQHGGIDAWCRGMGITWMTVAELREAIPPAYTAYIGTHLMAHLQRGERG